MVPDTGVANVFPCKPEREVVRARQNTLTHGMMQVPESPVSEVMPFQIRDAFPEIEVRDAVARRAGVKQQQERERFEFESGSLKQDADHQKQPGDHEHTADKKRSFDRAPFRRVRRRVFC